MIFPDEGLSCSRHRDEDRTGSFFHGSQEADCLSPRTMPVRGVALSCPHNLFTFCRRADGEIKSALPRAVGLKPSAKGKARLRGRERNNYRSKDHHMHRSGYASVRKRSLRQRSDSFGHAWRMFIGVERASRRSVDRNSFRSPRGKCDVHCGCPGSVRPYPSGITRRAARSSLRVLRLPAIPRTLPVLPPVVVLRASRRRAKRALLPAARARAQNRRRCR
jgi:hypothetical protein